MSPSSLTYSYPPQMRVSPMLLCLAVLVCLLLPETTGAATRGRGGRGGRGRKAVLGRNRQSRRRGRQEEEAAEDDTNDLGELDAAGADEGSGEELPNGCDPTTNIGGFLVFNGVKVWCGEQGVTDFGPYGGLPAEGSGEDAAASDVEGELVDAPEEVRRARKARARKGKQQGKKAGRRAGKKAGKQGGKRKAGRAARRGRSKGKAGKKAGKRVARRG